MAHEKFKMEILDYLALGEKIREWSVNRDNAPKTIGDLLKPEYNSIVRLGAGFEEPAKQLEEIVYIDAPPTGTVSIVIPNKDDLQIEPEKPYPIPNFYDVIYQNSPTLPDDDVEIDKFRSRRIADYAMNKCV